MRTIYPFRHFHLFSIAGTYSFVGAEMSVILRGLLLSELACFIVGLSNILDRELRWREPVEGPHR